MPKVSVSVPHDQDPAEVVKNAEPYIEKMINDFEGKDLEMEWEEHKAEFSFKSLAFTIKGDCEIDATQIAVNIELPFAAMMFKDKVEKALRKNLTRAIGGETPSE